MEYTYITQDEGLLVVASCFDGDIELSQGATTVGRINSKGIVTEVYEGSIIDRDFLHEDGYFRVSK
jgi:hypothetical protein